MGKYGEYNEDGSVKTEATECILTERPLAPPYDNTVRERVSGTPYFYRVLGSQYHRVTEDMRVEWRSDIAPTEYENVPAVESFEQTAEYSGKKKRDKWGVDPVVSSEFDTGNEVGQ